MGDLSWVDMIKFPTMGLSGDCHIEFLFSQSYRVDAASTISPACWPYLPSIQLVPEPRAIDDFSTPVPFFHDAILGSRKILFIGRRQIEMGPRAKLEPHFARSFPDTSPTGDARAGLFTHAMPSQRLS